MQIIVCFKSIFAYFLALYMQKTKVNSAVFLQGKKFLAEPRGNLQSV